jgi:hypothetical protein
MPAIVLIEVHLISEKERSSANSKVVFGYLQTRPEFHCFSPLLALGLRGSARETNCVIKKALFVLSDAGVIDH